MNKYLSDEASEVVDVVEALDQDREEIKEIIKLLDEEDSDVDMDSAITMIRRVVERDVP